MPEPIIEPPAPSIVAEPRPGQLLNDELMRKLDEAYKERDVSSKAKKAAEPGAKPATKPKETAKAPDAVKTPETASSPDQVVVPEPGGASEPVKAAEPRPNDAKPRIPDPDQFVPGKTRAADWERIKGERDSLRSEIEKLRAHNGKASHVDAAIVDDLKRERDDYAKRLQMVAIERDPQFEKEFSKASAAIIDMARSAAGITNADKVEKVLAMSPGDARDKAIDELMEGLPQYKQIILGNAISDMEKVRRAKQAKIDESMANWDRLQREQELEINRRREQGEALLMDTIRKWQDPERGLAVLQKRDGDTDWNSGVEETIHLAREIYSGNLDQNALARAAIWAASAPRLLQSMAALQSELDSLKEENAKLKGLGPGSDGKAGDIHDAADDAPPPPGASYGEIIAAEAFRRGLR